MIKEAERKGDYSAVGDFYTTTFRSFLEINALFKREVSKEYKTTDDHGVNMELVNAVYKHIDKLPSETSKEILKSLISCLLKDKRLTDESMFWPKTKDDLRAYLILLQNPMLNHLNSYVIFAHLLRQVSSLNDYDHHFLVHWFRKVGSPNFLSCAHRITQFASIRLFPPRLQDLPPMAKCSWWIPSATKVLALLNASNNLAKPEIIPYIEFYNSALDHTDLMTEYYAWQNPTQQPGFTFCQYPFVLSINAKRSILQRDSEQQMIMNARRSLINKVARRQQPDIGMLFLNINIRRSHLVEDSLNELARKARDLKKKLKVTFTGEPGLDMGGVTKEWFLLLMREIFNPSYGMFVFNESSKTFWFSTAPHENVQEYHLVGVLMGLAVYNSIILDVRLPSPAYKKLLSPAVVPANTAGVPVGIASMTADHFSNAMPDIGNGLKQLLSYEGNVEEDFGLSFQVSVTEFGESKTVELKPSGADLPVTNENREEYVELYIDWMLNKSVYHQFKAFYLGFHSVCASNALIMLRPEEVEMLVCGSPKIDMEALKKVTIYDGYKADDPVIRAFWDIILNMDEDMQKKILLFTTGSDRIPVGGMSEMTFKITKVETSQDMLPMSHTCFNQLVLPSYKSKRTLKTKLLLAINNAEGFGLE